MLGSNWRLFQKNVICYSNMSGKMSKILEKSGKSQGIPSGAKCRNHGRSSHTKLNVDKKFTVKLFGFFLMRQCCNIGIKGFYERSRTATMLPSAWEPITTLPSELVGLCYSRDL